MEILELYFPRILENSWALATDDVYVSVVMFMVFGDVYGIRRCLWYSVMFMKRWCLWNGDVYETVMFMKRWCITGNGDVLLTIDDVLLSDDDVLLLNGDG